MPRKTKYKNVRTLDQLYQGDEEHDDAPTRDWESDIARENRKFAVRQKKEQRLLELQSKRKAGQKKQQEASKKRKDDHQTGASQGSVKDLKIQPGESLREFNDRVNIAARLELAAKATLDRNKRRKEKRAEKLEERKQEAFNRFDMDEERPKTYRGPPRIRDVAERPPEIEFLNDKKRFLELAGNAQGSKEAQMKSMLDRAQSLYNKKQKTGS